MDLYDFFFIDKYSRYFIIKAKDMESAISEARKAGLVSADEKVTDITEMKGAKIAKLSDMDPNLPLQKVH